MFNKATTLEYSKGDCPNHDWITKEKFYEVFPKGYNECNFFSSPIECWAMSREEICRNGKRTALLDLSSHLKFQRKLQKTFGIGHSKDTELLTDLLNQNGIEPIINSPINNNLTMPDDNKKECFTCNNICRCSKLLPNRFKKHNNTTISSFSNGGLVLPETQLIDNFDITSIKSTRISNYILSNEEISISYIKSQNIFENYDDLLEKGHDSNNKEILYENNDILLINVDSPDNIESSSTTPLDSRLIDIEISEEDNIQDDSTSNEYNAYVNHVLKYFKLNNINDIFQDFEDDANIIY